MTSSANYPVSLVITTIYWVTDFSQGIQDNLLKMSLFAIKTGNGVTDGINVGAIKAFQIGEQYLLAYANRRTTELESVRHAV